MPQRPGAKADARQHLYGADLPLKYSRQTLNFGTPLPRAGLGALPLRASVSQPSSYSVLSKV